MSGGAARPALLLLGPTGSGKSPLGRALWRIAGWPHLDFGALLRQIAAGEHAHGLDPEARALVRALVAGNALFPDDIGRDDDGPEAVARKLELYGTRRGRWWATTARPGGRCVSSAAVGWLHSSPRPLRTMR